MKTFLKNVNDFLNFQYYYIIMIIIIMIPLLKAMRMMNMFKTWLQSASRKYSTATAKKPVLTPRVQPALALVMLCCC